MFARMENGFIILPGPNTVFTTRYDIVEIAYCGSTCWGCPNYSNNPGCKKKDEFMEADAWLWPLVFEAQIFSTLGQYCE